MGTTYKTRVTYSVEVWSRATADLGYGSRLAYLENAKNVGFANYLNDVPQAFFTVDQDDPKLALIRDYVGKAHVRIYRLEGIGSPTQTLVWAGLLLEADANERDVVFYCYGYLAALFWLHTDWNVQYKATQINTVVSDAWTRAKTTLTNSEVKFVSTGTIEAPVTTSGGAVAIVIPQYGLFHKKILYLLNEMAALGVGNTTNVVAFEITHASTPTFNFWKNKGSDKPNIQFEYGDKRVSGFSDIWLPVYRRNDIIAVGSAPNNLLLRTETDDAADSGSPGYWGRRQEVIYFPWVRDTTELARVSGLRAALSKRNQHVVTLRFFPNSAKPTAASPGWSLGDRVKVKIDRGATSINSVYYLVVGEKVLYVRGTEHVRLELQERVA